MIGLIKILNMNNLELIDKELRLFIEGKERTLHFLLWRQHFWRGMKNLGFCLLGFRVIVAPAYLTLFYHFVRVSSNLRHSPSWICLLLNMIDAVLSGLIIIFHWWNHWIAMSTCNCKMLIAQELFLLVVRAWIPYLFHIFAIRWYIEALGKAHVQSGGVYQAGQVNFQMKAHLWDFLDDIQDNLPL